MRITTWLGTALIAAVVMTDSTWAGNATPDSILVMPARKRVVQTGFQLAHCKDIGLVTYNNSPLLAAPLIHIWNGQEWIQISPEDFNQGGFMSGEPKRVFILGDDTAIPPQITIPPTWCKETHRISTLDTTALINQIGTVLKLSARDWHWMADQNGLSATDRNSERRRYGRWGAPGKEQDLAPTRLESIPLPPAPIMVEPKAELEPAPAKIVPAKKTPAKVELPKTPAVKVKPVAVKAVPAKVEVLKPAVPAIESQAVKAELPKTAPEAKIEAPKTTAPAKVEAPKAEAPKAEMAKPDPQLDDVDVTDETPAAP